MRVQKVFTNLTCDQNCTYCTSRSASDDPRFVARAAVVERIDAAIAGSAREVVLTGGEPMRRNDVPALVAHAKASGVTVVLETNATLIDAARARDLAAAGLDLARVNLSGATSLLDRVTRDEGGFERTCSGVRALIAAGVTVEIAVSLVRSTLPLLAGLPALIVELAQSTASVRGIVVTTPVEAPEPSEPVRFEEAADAIAELGREARPLGIALRVASDSGPPPCLAPYQSKSSNAYTLTPGGARRDDHASIGACSECLVADRCPGIARAYLERFGEPAARPIQEDRIRRRLSLVASVDDQIRREIATRSRHHYKEEVAREDRVIRVNFHCNQACRFCFVSTHLPPPPEDLVRSSIEEATRDGARVVLSGGEPTLNPRLVEYVAQASASSAHPVELQTNAVLLGEGDLVERLERAGLAQVFVSLHGSTAEVSDAVTSAPGTFVKTVAGLDCLARSSLRVIVNFVLCSANQATFADFVSLVATRWPKATVNVSFVAPSTDLVPRDRAMIPSYTEVVPAITAGLAVAQDAKLHVSGFESMCGIPLCLVPASLARYFDMSSIPEDFDGGEFVYASACEGCALRGRCYGVRRGYAELHGTSELRAVAAGEPKATPPIVEESR